MNTQAGLFDGIEAETKTRQREEYLGGFKYLARDYVDANSKRYMNTRYLSPVYSPAFQSLLDGFNSIRRELGYERITQGQAFEQALSLEKALGLENGIIFDANGINADEHIKRLNTEMNKMDFKPDYSGCYDTQDNSVARDDFYKKFRDDYKIITPTLNLKPLPPVRLDFDTVVQIGTDAVLKAMGHPEFARATEGQTALRMAIEKIVMEATPDLAAKHVIVERVPK